MPAANIQINAVAATAAAVPIGVAVQLSNADTGGEVTYAWTILDQPEGTPLVALSNPAIENPTFTPTREGTYRLRLVVNATLPTEATAYAEVQIAQVISGRIIPAAGELLEADASRGWATWVIRSLQDVDRLVGDSNVVVCISQGGASVGQVVQVGQGVSTYLTGLPGAKRALVSSPALAVEEANVCGRLGQIVAVCDGGSIADGKPVLVRMFGLSPFTVTTADSPAVGAWVFLDANGLPIVKWDPAATDVPRIVGRVVEFTGGKFRWMIDPATPMHRRVVAPASAQIWDGTAGWSKAGYGSAIAHWQASTNTATGLVYPLAVEPNEEVVYLQAEVNQSGSTAQIQARLRVGSLVNGNSLVSDWATSPAASGGSLWNIDVLSGASPLLPHLVNRHYGAQVEFQTANGGGARELGIITVWTVPARTT